MGPGPILSSCAPGGGRDVVTDFVIGVDVIEVIGKPDVLPEQLATDTLLSTGRASILLRGIDLADLLASDETILVCPPCALRACVGPVKR